MKQTYSALALVIAVLAMPIAAFAGENEATDGKSLSQLRKDLYAAEEDFYAVFNKLNDERDYDVKCFYEKPTGTHIKNHVCRARFITKAYSQNASRNRNDLSRVANQDANPVLAEKTAKYEQKMESLMAANPELQEAFARYNDARADFMAERERLESN